MSQPPPHLSLAGSIVQRFRNEGYRWPETQLPASIEVADPSGVFRFEAPWPWFELPVEQLEASTRFRSAADVAVSAPRSDGRDPIFGLVVTQDDLTLDYAKPKSIARDRCRNAGIVLEGFQKYVLDERRALLIDGVANADGWKTFLLFAPSGEHLVSGRCDVPQSQASGYRHHLVSMLATWQWA